MIVKVYRYNEQTEMQPHFDKFHVEISENNSLTVLDLLKLISRKIDPSLGYFMHSTCNHGVCKRCMVSLNGKVILACRTTLPVTDKIILEPVNKNKVIRDLVVKGL